MHISSTTDQDGVPPEDESRDEGSNETETLGILQPHGVEELLSSAPEAPDLTGAPVPDLGSASFLDSEGADPSSDVSISKNTPSSSQSRITAIFSGITASILTWPLCGSRVSAS